jgi:hypothetical protein
MDQIGKRGRTRTAASWNGFNSCSAMHRSTERHLGCKQNLAHPVNDLFDLRTDRRRHENNGEGIPSTVSLPG